MGILISINTVSNISNNISNNNNNNNNNLFNSNNVSERRKRKGLHIPGAKYDNSTTFGTSAGTTSGSTSGFGTTSGNTIDSEDEMIINALRRKILSPWNWKLFETIRIKQQSSMKLMHHWLYLVNRAFPECLQVLGCEFFNTFRKHGGYCSIDECPLMEIN